MSTRRLSDWQLYRSLWRYVTVHWVWLLFIFIAMIGAALIDPIFAGFLKVIIDQQTHTDTINTHRLLYPLLLLSLFVIRALLAYISTTGNAYVIYRLVNTLRSAVFAHIQQLPLDTLRDYGHPALVSRITYDALQVSELGLNAVSILVRDSLTIIGLCLLLLWYSPILSLFVVCVIPFIWLSVSICKRIQRDIGLRIQKDMGEFNALLTEGIEMQESVRVFQGETTEQQRVDQHSQHLTHLHIRQVAVGAFNSSAVQLLVGIALCLVLYFGGTFAIQGGNTIGTFVSFVTAMILLFQPFRRITTVGYVIQRGLAAAESIFHILTRPTESANRRIHSHTVHRPTNVVLRCTHLSFTYPHRTEPALHDINCTIYAGERIALVGESGCGKSTLLRLLLGFYLPTQGSIHVYDQDMTTYEPSVLRRYFAFVSQDTHLFNTSIRHNVAYGDLTSKDDQQIQQVLQQTESETFIRTLSEGWSTIIGQNGHLLSGGQRQRLQIARAFLKSSPILLLDEATSALDPETETHIQWPRNNTTLFVTHRLHLAAQCDRILVFQQGALVGSGTHDSLFQYNDHYTRLYQMSTRKEKQQETRHGDKDVVE